MTNKELKDLIGRLDILVASAHDKRFLREKITQEEMDAILSLCSRIVRKYYRAEDRMPGWHKTTSEGK